MKKIAACILFSGICLAHAQTMKLETGRKIISVTTTSMDADMGIGGNMTINSSTTDVVDITGADNSNYKANNTITRMVLKQAVMGREINYDSDKKEDADGQMGQLLSKGVNKPAAVLIDKMTGEVKSASPEKDTTAGDEMNPMSLMSGGSQNPVANAGAIFFVLPAGSKVGSKWSDSTQISDVKVVKHYVLQSLQDGIATVLMTSTTKGTISQELQGTPVNIAVNATGESTMVTDTKAGIITKNTTVTNTDGTLDVMGQSMPISMKINSTTIAQ